MSLAIQAMSSNSELLSACTDTRWANRVAFDEGYVTDAQTFHIGYGVQRPGRKHTGREPDVAGSRP